MQAPDRMHVAVGSGFENFIIGSLSYSRPSSTSPWRVQTLPASRFPSFIWDSSSILAPHIVGSAPVDGVQTQIIAFFEETSFSPSWFELWVGPDGLAHQSRMTAESHFMDQRYYDFDSPLRVQAPTD